MPLGQFSHKYSQNTPLSSPVRVRYGVSFVDPASDWYSASVAVIIFVTSYNITSRYMALDCISGIDFHFSRYSLSNQIWIEKIYRALIKVLFWQIMLLINYGQSINLCIFHSNTVSRSVLRRPIQDVFGYVQISLLHRTLGSRSYLVKYMYQQIYPYPVLLQTIVQLLSKWYLTIWLNA